MVRRWRGRSANRSHAARNELREVRIGFDPAGSVASIAAKVVGEMETVTMGNMGTPPWRALRGRGPSSSRWVGDKPAVKIRLELPRIRRIKSSVTRPHFSQ
jgi:hypothetical protein